ncbi:MAG: hypothetical protein IPK02_18270 [Candidatus Accumulibacter sp.]|uniref:PEP-CTERM sorting domain-containing protein n=1 Tax=Candidatus Accumulibacter affinis TaxID=2954384 RepID=A0A935TE76_9PROT|nr:hypothetical protein [Candidatus Accumulibacter affinis]
MKILAAFAFTFIIGAATANPIIYDNGLPTPSLGGWASDPGYSRQLGVDVVLKPGASAILNVRWWGGYCCHGQSAPDAFTLEVFSMTGDTPSAAPLSSIALNSVGRTSTGQYLSGIIEQFEYNVTLASDLVLQENVKYLFSISNNTASDLQNWFWSIHLNDGDTWARGNASIPWFVQHDEMAFQLFGPEKKVPEPNSFALSVAVLFGLLFASKRHKRTAHRSAGSEN